MTIDSARYRQIIGHFATGITVITTEHNGWLHGMTANAITSVSLDPLLLLICVDKSAHAHQQVDAAGRFAVNILGEEQEGLSRLFAATAAPEQGNLRGAGYHFGAYGSPVLEDTLAYLECEVAERCPGGDHTVFIGRVLDGDLLREAPPLVFFRGGYRRLGD